MLALTATLLAPALPASAQPAAPATARSPADNSPARSGVPAWFGLKAPGPETDPTRGSVEMTALDLPTLPASFGPGPHNPVLAGAAIKADVARIVDFSLQSRADGDFLWGRVTGRPGYDHTVAWVADQLRAAGLKDAHLETFVAPTFALPVAGEVRLVASDAFGAGSHDIVLQSAMVGGRGPVNGSATAPLVYIGQATDADLAGRDLRGKIAVINATPNPGVYSTNEAGRLQLALAAGAVGAIEILEQPGNMKSFDGDRHGCGTALCFTIGGEDGFFLMNMLGAAAKAGQTVNAQLTAKSETFTGAKVANVVATLPGRTDRVVIIDAHADAWFTGADDNASGLATFLALARYFAKQPKRDRTLVFVASAGHHTAANGLAAFRAAHNGDFVDRADLVVNLEHVASSGLARSAVERQDNNFGYRTVATTAEFPKQVGVSNRAPYLIDLWRQGVTCFGLSTQRVVDTLNPGELLRFMDRPTPLTQMISAGPLYHTSGETVASIPDAGLERAARFHAYLITETANAPAALLNGAAWAPRPACPRIP
jgi:hypothetical protein